jgi:multidrug efflux pump subunit AcrA (membrane-fusion protein)
MAYEETHLYARVPGYVRLERDPQGRIVYDIGRKITGPRYEGDKETAPGEVMAELVVPELREEVNQKNALTRQAQAEVEQARKALAAAEAHIDTLESAVVEAKALRDRWESESKRITKLAAEGAIEPQVRDETLNQYKAAAARVTSAESAVKKGRADRDKAKADVRAAEARVDVAKADALRAEAMLGYARIRAPYDGIVTARKVANGDFVQPVGGKGDWLFSVARLDPVRVVIAVPEADAGLVEEKMEVKLRIPALASPSPTGKVIRTSWALEPGSRTLRVEVDLPNKDGKIRPGMYVSAHLSGKLPETWTLPATAVVKQGDETVCFLIEGDKVVRTPVQTGRNDGALVEVPQYRRTGQPPSWQAWTGKEKVASKAAGLVDGQTVSVKAQAE